VADVIPMWLPSSMVPFAPRTKGSSTLNKPGREETQLASALNGRRAIVRTKLGVDVAHVRVDRVDRDVEARAISGRVMLVGRYRSTRSCLC